MDKLDIVKIIVRALERHPHDNVISIDTYEDSIIIETDDGERTWEWTISISGPKKLPY